ncbi:MAG: type II secretion system protein GspN [Thermodesulfobacteriota bacterium]
MQLKPNRRTAGYILAGITLFAVCLYLRFPGEALTDYLKAAARSHQTLLSLEPIRASFPPGLKAANVTVGFPDRPEATFQADVLSIRPRGLSLIKGELAFLMAAKGYGGEASGRVDFGRRFSLRGPIHAEATLRDVRIERCAWLREALARRVTGTLRGSLSLGGPIGAMKNMTGSVDFTLTNGIFPLVDGFLNFKNIDFSRIEGKISWQSGTMKITHLTLTSDLLRASLKGNILLADEFRGSQIDLTGTIEMPSQGNRRLTLNISGTLDDPKTRLM